MIKAILFDADGVIINTEMFSVQLAKDYHIDPQKLLPFFKNEFQKCLTGKADLKVELQPYLKQWGWTKSADDFLTYWFASEHKIDESLIAYIQTLRRRGIPCYMATNQEKYRTEYFLTRMGFAESFDAIFSSSQLGEKKPDTAFFKKILTNLKPLQAEEILFWDNSPSHINGAKQVGIHAQLYTNFEDLKKKTDQLLTVTTD